MGDFVIYKRDKVDDKRRDSIIETLAAQGSKNPRLIRADSHNILLYDKIVSPVINFTENENGDFCASSGCLFYRGASGKTALNQILQDFDPDNYSPHSFLGVFTLIIRKTGRLFIVSDPLGGSRIFHNQDQTFWSSSFLALAENTDHLSINAQGVYEYCFQETTYGDTTPLNEVKMADSLKYFELTEFGVTDREKNLPISFEQSTASYDNLIEEHSTLLQNQMQSIVSSYGPKIATALSGGYDSRLMLSLARNTGITPGVYVYGPDDSPDVTVAKAVADGEGFEIHHINKANHPKPTTEAYSDIVKDNFYALDGFPNEGIFDFGANMKTRRERAKDGTLILNGGGGEIYRNFFYLPDKNYSLDDLLNVFYSRFTNDFCTKEFKEPEYRANLKSKIKYALELEGDHMSRTQLEYAYPGFRLRYWTAKDNSNNNRLGSFLTPFISYETIMATLKVPLKYKTHGKFQSDLINRINPTMASYLSDYGYRFNEPVPFKKKLKNNMTIYRPSLLRRYSYAVQHKMADLSLPPTMQDNYLNMALPGDAEYISRYFNMPKIKDAALLGRALTLEYLFRHLDVQ